MTPPRVVLRVDADARIGVGHAVRSITLGAALVDRGTEVSLVSVALPEPLVERASRYGLDVQLVGASRVLHHLDQLQPSGVVVDGYHLAPLLPDLAARAIPYAVIDDNHELPIDSAALVLNQNLHAAPTLYPEATAKQRLLLGARYVLLRPDVAAIDRHQPREVGTRVLIALGGADPLGLTTALVTELLRLTDLDVSIGVGPANPRRAELEAIADTHATRLRVDKGDLVDGYRGADLAVIGAGTTLWEVGYLGLPALGVIVAENQVAAAEAAAAYGCLEAIDGRDGADVFNIVERCRELASDFSRRLQMSAAGPDLFDGRGAARVAAEIESLIA